MNDNKICFVTCVNDKEAYKESLYYIKNLNLPKDFEIDFISIENAKSITQGYNEAMNSSDAKYKVYLHQDVLIKNKNFIIDVLDIFNSNKAIGMIGVTGAEKIPSNGIWWESEEVYGKIYDSHTGKMEILSFKEIDQNYKAVQAIDGLIMITQYDTLWREDIFDGWHFYDISQSIEFKKLGYEVVIPKQEEPWCIHDCGIVNVKNGYEGYRLKFLEEYSEDIFPLVSILIPTYNQTIYLKEALESAINQTYPNIEIIIGDDSTTDEVEKFIEFYLEKYSNIKYFKNKRKGMDYGKANVENLFRNSSGKYIAYLLHDDIFHKEKIEKMIKYFKNEDEVSLVTSYRRLIDSNSRVLEDQAFNKRLFQKDTRVSGIEMSKYIVSNTFNPIGELSTAMFKRKDIEEEIVRYHDKEIRSNADIALWLKLLEKGDLIYIAQSLNYFRQHNSQNSNNYKIQLYGVLDNINFVEEFHKRQIEFDRDEYKKDLTSCYYRHCYILNVLDKIEDKELKKEFISKFCAFLKLLY